MSLTFGRIRSQLMWCIDVHYSTLVVGTVLLVFGIDRPDKQTDQTRPDRTDRQRQRQTGKIEKYLGNIDS